MMEHKKIWAPLPGLLLGFVLSQAVLIAGCGGGGGGSSRSGSGKLTNAHFLIGDAPRDDLLSFTAEVDTLQLERNDGRLTDDLLPGTAQVEFIDLQERFAWLTTARPAAGDYISVRVGFVPGSYVAVAEDGSPVTVNALADELVASFPASVRVDRGEYNRFEIDLDLFDSLQGDVSSGMITFDPLGSGKVTDGSVALAFDELQGIVKLADSSTGRLVVDAYLDDQLTQLFARLQVTIDPLTLLLTEANNVYLSAADFFDDVITNQSVVEVHGDLDLGGVVLPRWIRVQDRTGATTPGSQVELEGRIVGSTTGTEFNLRIEEVREGSGVALPVLAGITGPTVRVALGPLTRVILDAGDVIPRQDLVVGQAVKVAFDSFATEPFPAALVAVDELEPRFAGRITDIGGLPGAINMRLDDHEPALVAGQVASTATDVAVDLTGSTVVLDVEARPVLTPSQLLTDQRLWARGSLSGAPSSPNLQCLEVVVIPGRLADAQVATIDEANAAFTTTGGVLLAPFGGMVFPGPAAVEIDPLAVFRGDATTQAEFFALFNGLGTGETLVVETHGIGTGTPGEIHAFELEVEVL